MDNLVHTVNRGNGLREYFGAFDSFQNHSCDPNTWMRYTSKTKYDVIASRVIKTGDELTTDYELIDPGIDGTSFLCTCGAPDCRRVIHA